MKNLYLRTSLALACAFGLVACGGEDATLLLRVGISGVNKDGLTIRNNGGPALAVPANSTLFQFPDLIAPDSDFNVEIVTAPSNAKCEMENGKGKTGQFHPQDIVVRCIINLYNVGGTVSGLKTDGLIVINGGHRVEIPANATSFSLTKRDADGKPLTGFTNDGKPLSGQVGDSYAYGLTIFQQPAAGSGVCTIANGTGVMGAGDVTNVAISCN